jgi:hypothetical protein
VNPYHYIKVSKKTCFKKCITFWHPIRTLFSAVGYGLRSNAKRFFAIVAVGFYFAKHVFALYEASQFLLQFVEQYCYAIFMWYFCYKNDLLLPVLLAILC